MMEDSAEGPPVHPKLAPAFELMGKQLYAGHSQACRVIALIGPKVKAAITRGRPTSRPFGDRTLVGWTAVARTGR
jgi:hypothetical protein